MNTIKNMKSLLIISNNVLSKTNNNGKTILSFIEGAKDARISQLFLSGEVPRIKGYNYFRISDKDIIRGLCRPNIRGTCMEAIEDIEKVADDFSVKKRFGRNNFTLIVREMLWRRKWKSKGLIDWLEAVSPDAIFFIAGDACFAYSICEYIKDRYASRLTVYVTDDYVMPRKNEDLLYRIRRNQIDKHMKKILRNASCFYTISETMREAYRDRYGMDSFLAVNMTEDMKGENKKECDEIILTYAGSFYYKRDEVLFQIAKAIEKYNALNVKRKAKLLLYSNRIPEKEILNRLCISGSSEYKGSLNKEQLKKQLNSSDILVFVESLEEEQIEKVRYSLSTKVPEYLSIGKPILAVGPKQVGSMKYLEDVAICINENADIRDGVIRLLKDMDQYRHYGNRARDKYLLCHNKEDLQKTFLKNVLG